MFEKDWDELLRKYFLQKANRGIGVIRKLRHILPRH